MFPPATDEAKPLAISLNGIKSEAHSFGAQRKGETAKPSPIVSIDVYGLIVLRHRETLRHTLTHIHGNDARPFTDSEMRIQNV